MKTLKYLDTVISVPTGWGDITLSHYETFYTDASETPLDRIHYVAKVCKVDPSFFLDLPAAFFNKVVDLVFFIFEPVENEPSSFLEIEGVKYVVPIEDEMTLAAWIDAEDARKRPEKVLSTSLAIVCRPVGEAYDPAKLEARQEMFANLKVSDVLPVVSFFFRWSNVLKNDSRVFTDLQKVVDQLPPPISILSRRTGGIRLSTIWLAVKYTIMKKYTIWQLKKSSQIYSTAKTKPSPKTNNEN